MTAKPKLWVPPLEDTDTPETRIEGKHHVGCVVSQNRAAIVAASLFPELIANGGDCKNEYGREGERCRVCAERNTEWAETVRRVRNAMLRAFS